MVCVTMLPSVSLMIERNFRLYYNDIGVPDPERKCNTCGRRYTCWLTVWSCCN